MKRQCAAQILWRVHAKIWEMERVGYKVIDESLSRSSGRDNNFFLFHSEPASTNEIGFPTTNKIGNFIVVHLCIIF
jgi:hypothetical protein